MVLQSIQVVAEYAAYHHCGRFADGRLENRALAIGEQLGNLCARRTPPVLKRLITGRPAGGRRQVLHLVTSLEPIGGVTQAIRRWIQADGRTCHSLLAINQRGSGIPTSVRTAIAHNGGSISQLPPTAPLLDKAMAVRQVAQAWADLVFVHPYPHDVVPTLAFAVAGGPPVAWLNHSDQMFWLGNSVADLSIDWRCIGTLVSGTRRLPQRRRILPLPLDSRAGRARAEARQSLGIPDEQLMLLSVGRGVKYRPDGKHNFFRTASRILARNQQVHLYVVGVRAADAKRYFPALDTERCHCVGPLPDPSYYQAAADVYIEGFPFGSLTALLDAALLGVPAVGAYAPISHLLVANDDALADVLISPGSEDEYVARTLALLASPDERAYLGAQLRNRLLAAHTGPAWLEQLALIYDELGALDHAPRPLAPTECVLSETDCALAAWSQAVADADVAATQARDGKFLAQLFCELAYDLRCQGHYGEPLRLLRRALGSGADRWPLVKAMARVPMRWLRDRLGALTPRWPEPARSRGVHEESVA